MLRCPVSEIVNIHEAKTHLSRLVDRAHAGEEIILAKSGKPYAKLVPFDELGGRRPGLAQGRLTEDFFEDLPEAELRAWNK
jgi:prevent-host-death family protein